MPDVICLGEILIDFISTESHVTIAQAPAFEKKPGGAPANVACGLARLGVSAAFIGKVGQDHFGEFLRETLSENNVDTAGLAVSSTCNTTLAFVSLAGNGERSFAFYRNPGADTQLTPDDLPRQSFQNGRIFHFGSLSLTHEPARSATLAALDLAEANSMLISYDPNLRPALWPSLAEARTQMLQVMKRVHLLKISEEEAQFLTGSDSAIDGARQLLAEGPSLVLLTLGEKGCCIIREGIDPIEVPGMKVLSIDTTGAGDAFMAAFLSRLIHYGTNAIGLCVLGPSLLTAMARFANAAGALATTKKGAIPAMPSRKDVEGAMGED